MNTGTDEAIMLRDNSSHQEDRSKEQTSSRKNSTTSLGSQLDGCEDHVETNQNAAAGIANIQHDCTEDQRSRNDDGIPNQATTNEFNSVSETLIDCKNVAASDQREADDDEERCCPHLKSAATHQPETTMSDENGSEKKKEKVAHRRVFCNKEVGRDLHLGPEGPPSTIKAANGLGRNSHVFQSGHAGLHNTTTVTDVTPSHIVQSAPRNLANHPLHSTAYVRQALQNAGFSSITDRIQPPTIDIPSHFLKSPYLEGMEFTLPRSDCNLTELHLQPNSEPQADMESPPSTSPTPFSTNGATNEANSGTQSTDRLRNVQHTINDEHITDNNA